MFLKRAYLKFKFWLMKTGLIKAGADIVDVDPDNYAYLINFDGDSAILVSLEENGMLIRLETTIIFDSALINMKTLSSIAHAAYFCGFGVTGISQKNKDQVKLYLGKEMDFSSLLYRFGREVVNMHECIQQLAGYLYYRSIQLDERHLDLSMFNEVDLFLFDPQSLGEKKDFVYKDWSTYINSVLNDEESDSLIDPNIMAMELQACAEFEKKNGLSLSEVGDEILQEIIWHRKFTEMMSEDEYSVN